MKRPGPVDELLERLSSSHRLLAEGRVELERLRDAQVQVTLLPDGPDKSARTTEINRRLTEVERTVASLERIAAGLEPRVSAIREAESQVRTTEDELRKAKACLGAHRLVVEAAEILTEQVGPRLHNAQAAFLGTGRGLGAPFELLRSVDRGVWSDTIPSAHSRALDALKVTIPKMEADLATAPTHLERLVAEVQVAA